MISKPARWIALLCALACCAAMTGCWSSTEINQLAIIMGIGVDVGSTPGSYLLTAQIARPSQVSTLNGPGGSEKPYINVQQEGQDINMAMHEMMRQISRRLYTAHNQVIVISNEVATEDISTIIDYFVRSQEGRFTVQLIIADGKASDILNETVDLEQMPAMHLRSLLSSQIVNSHIDETSLFGFLNSSLARGIAPTVPMVYLIEDENGQKKARVEGSGIFVDGKLVGLLNTDRTRAMQIVKNEVQSGYVNLSVRGEYVSLDVIESQTTLTPRIENGRFTVTIRVQQEAKVVGIGTRLDITQQGVRAEIEQTAANDIIYSLEDMLVYTQSLGADICGFGALLHKRFPSQTQALLQSWPEAYKQLSLELDVQTIIEFSGALLEPITPKGENK